MKAMKAEEIERAAAAYLGSKSPIAGDVSIGAHHVPVEAHEEIAARFAAHGLSVAIQPHETEKGLAVMRLRPLPASEQPPAEGS